MFVMLAIFRVVHTANIPPTFCPHQRGGEMSVNQGIYVNTNNANSAYY